MNVLELSLGLARGRVVQRLHLGLRLALTPSALAGISARV